MATSIDQGALRDSVYEAYEKFGFEILERGWGNDDASIGLIAHGPKSHIYIFADLYLPAPDGTPAPKEDLSEVAHQRYLKVLADYAAHKNIDIELSRYDAVHVSLGRACNCIHRYVGVFEEVR